MYMIRTTMDGVPHYLCNLSEDGMRATYHRETARAWTFNDWQRKEFCEKHPYRFGRWVLHSAELKRRRTTKPEQADTGEKR